MTVTPSTPFRLTGNTDRASFKAALARTIVAGVVPPPYREADAIYEALAPYGLTRLAIGMAWIERRNETDPGGLAYYPRSYHNLWAVKRPDGGWAQFNSYRLAAEVWGPYVLGPTYAHLTTIAEFIGVYAPWSDGNDPAAYGRHLCAEINALPLLDEGGSVPDEINWEPLPRPAMRRAIVTKSQNGDGFTRTTSRGPRTIGCCNHITDGDPAGDEIEFYRAFFSIGGERARDALVDTVIARNGEIGLLNDWEDDTWGGTRAGWANGGTDGLTAVGQAIVARYPGNQINEVLVSKEHVARSGQAITDAQMASSIALSAYVAQSAKVRWDTYPKNANGLHVELLHTDFAAKACPAEPFISTYYPVLVREVKTILTKHQTGSTNPNPPPPDPVSDLPAWLTEAHVKAAFADFDPNGIVSKALVRYIAKSGTLPVFRERREAGENASIWVFDRVTIVHNGTVALYEGEA